MNVYHIFDFIDYMMDNEHITESSQIDFYYAWSPLEVALSNLPQPEKLKIENFISKHKERYHLKTQSELNSMIDFMNSYTTQNDEWTNDNTKTLH